MLILWWYSRRTHIAELLLDVQACAVYRLRGGLVELCDEQYELVNAVRLFADRMIRKIDPSLMSELESNSKGEPESVYSPTRFPNPEPALCGHYKS